MPGEEELWPLSSASGNFHRAASETCGAEAKFELQYFARKGSCGARHLPTDGAMPCALAHLSIDGGLTARADGRGMFGAQLRAKGAGGGFNR